MPILTLEAIRENPWNVVAYKLPPHPRPLLINVAYLAAEYCHRSEYMFMISARDGGYAPHGWDAFLDHCRPHEESEARAYDAREKLEEICAVGKKEFGWLTVR